MILCNMFGSLCFIITQKPENSTIIFSAVVYKSQSKTILIWFVPKLLILFLVFRLLIKYGDSTFK